MGYRSNVKVVFYTMPNFSKPEEELPMAALKLWFDENYPIHVAKSEWDADIHYGDDYILVSYDDVKWYSGYNHPGHVQEVCKRCVEVFGHKVAYETARTGEEASDIEHTGSEDCDWRLYISREIVFS